MNRRRIILALGGAAVVAFGAGAYLYQPPAPPAPPPAVANTLERFHSPSFGPKTAPVTIVEFFDPSCEACRAFYPPVKQILERHPEEVRLVLRYAPFHSSSEEAVRILEAARLQDKYQPVLEALLATQPTWANDMNPNTALAWQAAGQAGLDLDRARAEMNAPAIDAVLASDRADLAAAGVRQTPTFFVNGKPLPAVGVQELYDLVLSELGAS